MYSYYNPSPAGKNVGDCTVRAVSKALGQDWEKTYIGLCLEGLDRYDMPSANDVWGAYLRHNGFVRRLAPDDITVAEFSEKHPSGVYVLALSGHVVCIEDGVLYDTWRSDNETVLYYWERSK